MVTSRWVLIQPEGPPLCLLLLQLSKNICGDGRVEVDSVVAETLRRFVALPTPALERFAHPYLGSVAILGMILDSVHVLWQDQLKTFLESWKTNTGNKWRINSVIPKPFSAAPHPILVHKKISTGAPIPAPKSPTRFRYFISNSIAVLFHTSTWFEKN